MVSLFHLLNIKRFEKQLVWGKERMSSKLDSGYFSLFIISGAYYLTGGLMV